MGKSKDILDRNYLLTIKVVTNIWMCFIFLRQELFLTSKLLGAERIARLYLDATAFGNSFNIISSFQKEMASVLAGTGFSATTFLPEVNGTNYFLS